MDDLSLNGLRFAAKRMQRAHRAGEAWAVERLKQYGPGKPAEALVRADFLHAVAREAGFESWPRLKLAAEAMGLDRAAALQGLKQALFRGQTARVEALLARFPDLADGVFGLECALYRRDAVEAALAREPGLAVAKLGPRTPILHLAFSRWIHARPGLEADMLAVAELLLAHGADVNDGYVEAPGSGHALSALYGAVGHADNMVLAQWLLDKGADPDDGESLYHSTELGHHRALRMLLEAGAEPKGTNALFRAMDFHDHAAVEMLLAHGARADEFSPDEVGGEAPSVVPALHQAARRMSDARMVGLLLEAGAGTARRWMGVTAYAMARVYGNRVLARALEARGADTGLSREEGLLAAAAEGRESPGQFIDPEKLPGAFRGLLRELVHLPDRLEHMRRLVALGVPYDEPGGPERITPTHVAGWEGKPEVLAWFLSLRPDLGFVNGFGGTLLSTILHGAENNPARAERDHIGCARLALEQGVALPRAVIEGCGREDMAAFLRAWAEARPGQVADGPA